MVFKLHIMIVRIYNSIAIRELDSKQKGIGCIIRQHLLSFLRSVKGKQRVTSQQLDVYFKLMVFKLHIVAVRIYNSIAVRELDSKRKGIGCKIR